MSCIVIRSMIRKMLVLWVILIKEIVWRIVAMVLIKVVIVASGVVSVSGVKLSLVKVWGRVGWSVLSTKLSFITMHSRVCRS